MQVFLLPSINQFHYINLLFLVAHWLAMSSSCVNPFVYSIYSTKFRTEFKHRLTLRWGAWRPVWVLQEPKEEEGTLVL